MHRGQSEFAKNIFIWINDGGKPNHELKVGYGANLSHNDVSFRTCFNSYDDRPTLFLMSVSSELFI